MQPKAIQGLFAAALLTLVPSAASALLLDANITDIHVDHPFVGDSVADLAIDPSGDSATATFSAGNIVEIDIIVSNPLALDNVGSGAVKVGSPSLDPLWVQQRLLD